MTGDRSDFETLRRGMATLGDLAPEDDGLLEAVLQGAARRRMRRRAGAVLAGAAFVAVAAALAISLPPAGVHEPPANPTPDPNSLMDAGAFDGAAVAMSVVSLNDVYVAVHPSACAGKCPRLEVTHDGGSSWEAVETDGLPDGVDGLAFADTTTGWAMVRADDRTPRHAVRTDDGGHTWQAESLNAPQILVADGVAYAQESEHGTSSNEIRRWNGSGWERFALLSDAVGPVALTAGPGGLFAEYATAPGDANRVVRSIAGGQAVTSPCAAPPDSLSANGSRLWLLCTPEAGSADVALSSTDGVHWQESPAGNSFPGGSKLFAAGSDWAVVSVALGESYAVSSNAQAPLELTGGSIAPMVKDVAVPDPDRAYLITSNGWLYGARPLTDPWPSVWRDFSPCERASVC